MKSIKTIVQFLLGKLLVIAIIAFGLLSCNQEEINSTNVESSLKSSLTKSKDGKIDICHYSDEDGTWVLLNVSVNSWGGHSNHGDVWLDQDSDGHTIYNECGIGTMDDCNDEDNTIYPGAEDLCGDDIDQNCDGVDGYVEDYQWFYLWIDADEDGWSDLLDYVYSTCRPDGYLSEQESNEQIYYFDCDDSNSNVYPGAPEICDDIDNNCNGLVLDRVATVSFEGQDYPVGAAIFGPTGTVTAPWTTISTLACEPVAEDLTGKIVFIDRGECFFEWKVYHAQINGAVGVVVCSPTGPINMTGPGDYEITIPSICVDSEGCLLLQAYPEVSFTVSDFCIGPSNRIISNKVNDKFSQLKISNDYTIDANSGEFVKQTIQE